MSTQAWFDIFPHCSLSNTISCRLNHSPILMCLFQSSHFVRRRWFLLRIPSLNRMTLIQLSQTSIQKSSSPDIIDKLHCCVDELFSQGTSIQTHFRKDIIKIKQEMESLRACTNSTFCARFLDLHNQLNSLLHHKEVFWRQHEKLHWLCDGDSNSKYFHNSSSARIEMDDQIGISYIAKRYFENLFSSHGGYLDTAIPHLSQRLDGVYNVSLWHFSKSKNFITPFSKCIVTNPQGQKASTTLSTSIYGTFLVMIFSSKL